MTRADLEVEIAAAIELPAAENGDGEAMDKSEGVAEAHDPEDASTGAIAQPGANDEQRGA